MESLCDGVRDSTETGLVAENWRWIGKASETGGVRVLRPSKARIIHCLPGTVGQEGHHCPSLLEPLTHPLGDMLTFSSQQHHVEPEIKTQRGSIT